MALTEGRCSFSNFKILFQVKEQNSPQGIALAKVVICIGPAGMAEFHKCASAVAERELEASDGADGMARSCYTLPLDGVGVGFEDLPLEARSISGMRGEGFVFAVRACRATSPARVRWSVPDRSPEARH